MGVVAFVTFVVAGFGFGFAAPPKWKWLPLLFPLLLALGAMVKYGVEGTIVARLIVALLVTAGGIVLGWLVDLRSQRSDQTRYA